jgi:hypothetical protein
MPCVRPPGRWVLQAALLAAFGVLFGLPTLHRFLERKVILYYIACVIFS